MMYLAFLDITKAYDSVNREILWEKLAKLGIWEISENANDYVLRGLC